MDKTDLNITSFRFIDPQQQRIYEELRELVGPGPASFFKDACWLIEHGQILDSTSHLVGHLLREIESALRGVLKTIAACGLGGRLKPQLCNNQDGGSHKLEIKQILQFLGFSEDSPEAQAWIILADTLHYFAHRRNLDSPRPPWKILDPWEKTLVLLDVLLKGIRYKFLEWFPLLDELLAKTNPSKKDIKFFRDNIPNNIIIQSYFFDRLQRPGWIKPLWRNGFFRFPPGLERDMEQGTIRFPPWPEARYLARMANSKPELVACIIMEMEDTDNAAVHVNLVDAALNMPPEISARLVEKAVKWAKSPYLPLPVKLGELMIYWANGNMTEEAISLACALLDVFPAEKSSNLRPEERYALPPEPRARFSEYEYEHILKNYYPELVRAAPLPALELLCDLLGKATRLSRHREDDKGPEDLSYVWRPAIEDHTQNLGHTLKDALVEGVRDAAEVALRSGSMSIQQVVETLERRGWKIFQRITLHILRLFSEQAEGLVATHLTDRRLFDDVGVWHEYALLLRSTFSQLSGQDQRMILNWIEEGPDEERFKKWRLEQNGAPPSEDEFARYREIWQLDRLAWIELKNLPADWQERYKSMVAKHGEPEHPEFPVYGWFVWVGPTSPKTAKELAAMPVESIVSFLKTWRPPENAYREPSPEGLARILSSVVAEAPQRFAIEAARFQGLDPTYVRALLSGLREGLKQQKAFEWNPVLLLCRWVVDQPREIPGRKVDTLEADPDWGWARKAIADLLSAGFEKGGGEIPIEMRKEVWRILLPLTEDPDPTPEYEERYGGTNMDPVTLSINSTRGEAIHAVIRYALWVRRHLEKQTDSNDRLARGFDEMPEVREVLEAHLDVTHDPSLAVRAVYGQWFPELALLDPTWAEARKGRIFPLDEESQAYFDAAWNAYVVFCRPYDNVFDLLRDAYMHAVKRMGDLDDSTSWVENPDKRLIEHLMTYYWRGKVNLQDPLLVSFWEEASDMLRAYAIEFIGHALWQTESMIPPEITIRLQNLWNQRLSRAQEAPSKHEKEVSAFGWWFVSEKLDPNWSVANLMAALKLVPKVKPGNKVIEHLARTVITHPLESVECLRRIAEGDREGWQLYGSRDEIRQILQVGLSHPEVREEAEAVIHYLGSRGFHDYRDLLKI
jgi:hypothetical protein